MSRRYDVIFRRPRTYGAIIQKNTVGIHLHRTYGVIIQKIIVVIHLHRTHGVMIQKNT